MKYSDSSSPIAKLDTCIITLKRIEFTNSYTIGQLFLNGQYFCDTIEDKYRDLSKEKKVYCETAIPFGPYKVVINHSPKFGRLMPRLLNVPHFEGILIHSGNTEKSSCGCIIVGRKSGKMVINSKDTFNKLFERLKEYSNLKINVI